jgi:hypothetical protein
MVLVRFGGRKGYKRRGFGVLKLFILLLLVLAQSLLFLVYSRLRAVTVAVEDSATRHRRNILFYAGDDNQHNKSRILDSEELPVWIRNYLKWHQEMRSDFPGMMLMSDPKAPKLIVRTCVDVICGGLNDRLGQLPWDLYLANQTGRLLLMHWHMPVHLEYFLLPNELDWRIPKEMEGFFSQEAGQPLTWDDQKRVMATFPDFFQDYRSGRPSLSFFENNIDQAIQRAVSGEFKNEKLLRHRMLGHLGEQNLERRLENLGETDMLHWTPSFGKIFKMFFKPSPALAAEIRHVYGELHLLPNLYSAVHCRVRHPKATSSKVNVIGKDNKTVADISGLPWYGEMREFAVGTAVRALECARSLAFSGDDAEVQEPVYFFSDSNDLVNYIAHELRDPEFLKANANMLNSNPVDAKAVRIVRSFRRIMARDSSQANIHIDRLKGYPPADYYSTFVDLILAANARCITYGIGNYALFATKLASTSCRLLYTAEEWGERGNKFLQTQQCRIR